MDTSTKHLLVNCALVSLLAELTELLEYRVNPDEHQNAITALARQRNALTRARLLLQALADDAIQALEVAH